MNGFASVTAFFIGMNVEENLLNATFQKFMKLGLLHGKFVHLSILWDTSWYLFKRENFERLIIIYIVLELFGWLLIGEVYFDLFRCAKVGEHKGMWA